jgi:hypothetical protein
MKIVEKYLVLLAIFIFAAGHFVAVKPRPDSRTVRLSITTPRDTVALLLVSNSCAVCTDRENIRLLGDLLSEWSAAGAATHYYRTTHSDIRRWQVSNGIRECNQSTFRGVSDRGVVTGA